MARLLPIVALVLVVSSVARGCNLRCLNGGKCVTYNNKHNSIQSNACSCKPGFIGARCQTRTTKGVTGVAKKSGASPWTKEYREYGVISDVCDKAPPHLLTITYAGRKALRSPGVILTPTQVRHQPLVMTWPKMDAKRYYTIIMIDPDMPSRQTPVKDKTPVLHWLKVNIPGSGIGGRSLAPYIGSGPPKNTGHHRYNFFVFDEGLKPKDYSKIPPFDSKDINRRVEWNLALQDRDSDGDGILDFQDNDDDNDEIFDCKDDDDDGDGIEDAKDNDLTWTLRDFIAWAKIGQPIAGNFYEAKWDRWVDKLWNTFVDEDGYGC